MIDTPANESSNQRAVDTLPKLLEANATHFPDAVALREKEFGIWQEITWASYLARVRRFSLGLVALGLERGARVAVIGDNRPEWVIAELATQTVGGLSVGVYQDSVADEVRHILALSRARVVVAEDQEQVDKVLGVRDRLPELRHIVYYDPRGLSTYDTRGLVSFPTVEDLGAKQVANDPDAFGNLVDATNPHDIAMLCTTSGTTSEPKLAMLSHNNVLSMARQFLDVDPLTRGDEFVSFLPLAWIGEQMMTLSCQLLVGFPVNFPEDVSTVQRDVREIGPRVMFSPPRIWENLLSDVQVKIEDAPRLKRRIYDWAIGVGETAAEASFAKQIPTRSFRWKRRLAEWLALLSVKDQLGLRHLRRGYTGGAALGSDVFRFFHALGINLKQIYGQTEVSGIAAMHRDGDVQFQTVGRPLAETEVRISEDGEVLTRSQAVFRGYFENPTATESALADGWLRSGDAGYIDPEGHLVVIDRAADVMTLSDQTTFSPQFVENKLKFSSYVREAVVFGGDRPFVTALVAIDYDNTGKWAEKRNIAYTTFTDLAQKEQVRGLVREHVAVTNSDLPKAARIRRVLLLHKELDADDAELTRTRKVRRRFVASRYEALIEALYGTSDVVPVQISIALQDGRSLTVATDLHIETMF